MRINKNKLTPYDLQILNLLALTPGVWQLGEDSMLHPDFGNFVKSFFGLQAGNHKANTSSYRRLSWRAQILMYREWKRMVSAVVEQPERVPTAAGASMMAMSPSALGMGMLQQAAQPSLLQQMERAQRQLMDQALVGGKVTIRPNGMSGVQQATAPPPKDDMADAFSYMTSVLGAGVRRDQIKLLIDGDVVAKDGSAG